LESLAKSGALDGFAERGLLVAQYDKVAEFSKSAGDVGASQTDMFESLGKKSAGASIEFTPQEPAGGYQKLQWEKETLGLYVSSHPLAGLRKYIGKKARLIESLTGDDVGRKVTVAGIVEQTKLLHTKKGESMAVMTVEDPTGKMEVMLFPRTYALYKDLVEKPDSILVMAGILDMRMGQPQLKLEAMKRASLETMVQRAKEDGLFNEDEAKNWRGTKRKDVDDVVDVVTEEGEIQTERVAAPTKASAPTDGIHGPLANWIYKGMKTEEPIEKLGLTGFTVGEKPETSEENSSSVQVSQIDAVNPSISIHTITLPTRAPRALLLEVKTIFETFPGREKIQLKIGEEIIPVGMTVTMSPILEKRIEEAVKKYAAMV
jgi:hypothetical protein